MRLRLSLLLLVALLAGLQPVPANGADFYEAHEGKMLLTDEYTEKLAEELRGAGEEIIVWQYLVMGRGYVPRVRKLLRILKKKAENGVRVKMILDSSREDDYGNPINGHLNSFFGTAPVQVNLVSEAKVMHCKTVIIDGEKVFMGSQNWTKSGLSENVELAMYLENKKLAWKLKEDLQEMLDKAAKEKQLQPGTEDINSVSRKQLLSLPMFGSHYVDKIIEYRDRQEGAITVKELGKLPGVGDQRLEVLHRYFGR